MKSKGGKAILALSMTTVLAGCGMIPAQNQSALRARSPAPLSASAGWANITEMDRESVRLGRLPPEVIQYDLQIAQMIPEGEAIVASHNEAKARIWAEKMNSIEAARNKAMGKIAATEVARTDATPNTLGDGKPDPCLSPMGKNICTARPATQQSGTTYTAGPDGIRANVGGILVGPGGIGGP